MLFLQFRKSAPEDTFLIPGIFVAIIVYAIGILAALFISVIRTKSQPSKVSETSKNSNAPVEETDAKPEYYIVLGKHEIPIEPKEAKKLRQQNYTVVKK